MGMKLHLCLVEARNLYAKDNNGFSDPYVRVTVGDQKTKSSVIYESLNPSWNEEFFFPVEDPSEVIHISVWDEDYMTDDFLGQLEIPISQILDAEGHAIPPTWYPLQKRKPTSKISGEICIGLSLLGKPDAAIGGKSDPGIGGKSDAGVGGKSHGSVSPFSWKKSFSSSSTSTASGGSIDVQEEKENGSHRFFRRLRDRRKPQRVVTRSKSPGRLAETIREAPMSASSSAASSPTRSLGCNEDAEADVAKPAEGCSMTTEVDPEGEEEVITQPPMESTVDPLVMAGPTEAAKLSDPYPVSAPSVPGNTAMLERAPAVQIPSDPDPPMQPDTQPVGRVQTDQAEPYEPPPNDEKPDEGMVPLSWFDEDGVHETEAVTMPSVLTGGVVLEQAFCCTAKKLNRLFFAPGSEIVAEWQKQRKITMFKEGPWKMNEDGLPSRQVTYTMPASSLVKATKASETQTYSQAQDGCFVVDICVSTPDVPYGSTFVTEVQVCIFPEKAPEAGGEGAARMRVSWRARFVQSTMMKGMIENGMKKGISESYAQCLEVITKFIKPVDAKEKDDKVADIPRLEDIMVKTWQMQALEFLSVHVGKLSAAAAFLLLLTLCVHILYAKAKVTQGLEFWWLDLPDSFTELLIAGLSFLVVERVVIKLLQFLWVSLIKGGEHGVKGKGEGWMVTITLLEARSLATADLTGFSDPYVVFTCNGKTRSSSIKLQTLNPTWNEILEFDAMEDPPSVMEVAVYDYDGPFLEPDELGTCEINFLKKSAEELRNLWIPLEGRRARAASSELHLRVFLHNSKADDPVICPEVLEKASKQIGGRITKRTLQQNIQFQKLFSLPDNEPLINDYACSLKKKIYIQGRLFVSLRLLGFYSNLFGHKTKFVILWEDIDDMKERHPSETYGLIPSITVYVRKGRGLDARLGSYSTDNDGRLKFRFSSFVRPGPAFRTIRLLWQYRTLSRDELMEKIRDIEEKDKPDDKQPSGTPADEEKDEISSLAVEEAEMSEGGSQKDVAGQGRRTRRVASCH